MTRDRARKKAIRARMAASGEPYSVAARRLDAAPSASGAAVEEVIARANATLAAPSLRFEYRRDTDFIVPERRERPRPGPVWRLARHAARSAWDRISPEMSPAEFGGMLHEAFRHTAGSGFAEPAADRFQVDYGGYAELRVNGQVFGGASGAPLRAGNRMRLPQSQKDDLLGLLGLLRGVTQARYAGEETLRGAPCRTVAVQAGAEEFTVWIDDEHVRKVRSESHGSPRRSGPWTRTTTFELWDFGVPADALDWSRLPSFRASG